ncbi:amino acid ABC transporter permease [Grimontia sp. NTOU-MAR1]|uniref:amino acid ABC transporter permease n=1 Tax=Grimontia sp. NTOU-MAR1 TaxID=3111011 RepID=UPI002DBD5403|nr:ABC transporter permease subunit [Grimontia sp. NTOU-MAR1]WRW00993.1 ABC transporter permease subunit [Grimontia sp. NTOU-MAR1]
MDYKGMKHRTIIWQSLFFILMVFAGHQIYLNVQENLNEIGIALSYQFLWTESGFDISDSIYKVSSSDTYLKVLLAGVVNTIALASVCIIGASLIGMTMGILRTSKHGLSKKSSYVYIELMRNTPKLLILLFVYTAVINALPNVRESWSLLDLVFISNRAIYFPVPGDSGGFICILYILSFWLISNLVLISAKNVFLIKHSIYKKAKISIFLISIALTFYIIFSEGYNFVISFPEISGFDYEGGGRISMQFIILSFVLSIYHGGQVAEIFRGAIESIPKGQFEAALSSGLTKWKMYRLVILPQAIRVATLPMGNQYLNITKNTSIALAVGYSDLVSITTTSINQTFRPIELMTLSMCVYLGISIIVSSVINSYNKKVTSTMGLKL